MTRRSNCRGRSEGFHVEGKVFYFGFIRVQSSEFWEILVSLVVGVRAVVCDLESLRPSGWTDFSELTRKNRVTVSTLL